MKKSNLFLIGLSIVVVAGMILTNVNLKKEYQKIDLTNPHKNYVSVAAEAYSVLDISGSNGYPIEVRYQKTNDIKVLRSRLSHFKSIVKNDTLFIEFTGSNISMQQRFNSNTPPGIIVGKNKLSSIEIADTHNRVSGFSNQDLKLVLKGNSYTEISDCNINLLEVDMKNNSQIEFVTTNTADSLDMTMRDKSIARMQEIHFQSLKHRLSDSVVVVLSKGVFKNILK
ncbi:hypothetical protein [Psychroserpens sp. S379A]|uniref:hypothetical protein n=1 Tax=Psychroserpens sp. S379A TaxID=3415137 RepID=UPI003C7B4C26